MPARTTSTRRPAGQASRSRSGSTANKRPPAKRSGSSRKPTPRKTPGGGPLWRMAGGTYSLLARGAGGLARSVARPEEAEPLAPEHRRDGAGLAVRGVAVVRAAAVRPAGIGPVGVGVAAAARWAAGNVVVVLPVLFFFV